MDFVVEIVEIIVGDGKVICDINLMMGGEDFFYMLEECLGVFIFVGNGDSVGLYYLVYDFNDDFILVGCFYWVKLVEIVLFCVV